VVVEQNFLERTKLVAGLQILAPFESSYPPKGAATQRDLSKMTILYLKLLFIIHKLDNAANQ
jgi:hypothetical protein